MAKFSLIQRLLRRSRLLRGLALLHLKRIRAQQLDVSWAYTQSVLVQVGNLMISWAGIERQLNQLICSYHPYAPATMKRKLPDNLSDKINYLVTMGRDQRLPGQLREAIAEWVPKLGRLRNHRHLIVHGMLFQRSRFSTDWFCHELKLEAGNPKVVEHRFTNEQLSERAKEIHELGHHMAEVLNPIFFGENWQDWSSRRHAATNDLSGP